MTHAANLKKKKILSGISRAPWMKHDYSKIKLGDADAL
jgi:hypothetical protein